MTCHISISQVCYERVNEDSSASFFIAHNSYKLNLRPKMVLIRSDNIIDRKMSKMSGTDDQTAD